MYFHPQLTATRKGLAPHPHGHNVCQGIMYAMVEKLRPMSYSNTGKITKEHYMLHLESLFADKKTSSLSSSQSLLRTHRIPFFASTSETSAAQYRKEVLTSTQ